MIKIYNSDTHSHTPVDRGDVLSVTAAIVRGDADTALLELGRLLDSDSECVEWINQGRVAAARCQQVAA